MNSGTDNNSFFSADGTFDLLYSMRAQQLSAMHWTPISVARPAAAHLTAGKGKKILDIGSGVGKFCLVGAHYFPDHHFFGIEQRKALVDEAIIAQKATNVTNATFLHGNFTDLDMDQFDHIYFYNSFGENVLHYKPIDNMIQTSVDIYDEYLAAFQLILDEKPAGTRLATYHFPDEDVPESYQLVNKDSVDRLSLWVKR